MSLKKVLVAAFILSLAWTAAVAWQGPSSKGKLAEGPPASAEANKVLLETVGALSATQLYQSYLNIGFIADGKAEGTYSAETALELLGTAVEILDTLDKQRQKVAKLDLRAEDREALKEIARLSALLRQEAAELQAYWKTGNRARAVKYEQLRQLAWLGISNLLSVPE
jgi:hypothetical protein